MAGAPSLADDLAQDAAAAGAQSERTARHSGKLLVRMPATLHDELARAAESEGVSLNQFITGVLAGAVEWGSPDDRAQLRMVASSTGSGRDLRVALVANFVVVVIAAIAAITLLVVAWQTA
jgi:hypothetical protein